MPLSFVIVEDDYYDWEWLKAVLEESFPDVGLVWISTEKAFRDKFGEFVVTPPAIFVLDVMLPWDVPRPGQSEVDVPGEVRKGGFYTAGLRCAELLKQDIALKNVPRVLYTGLDVNNFPDFVVHTKTDDPKALINEIRKRIKK